MQLRLILFCWVTLFHIICYSQSKKNKSTYFPPLQQIEQPDKKIKILKTDSLTYEQFEYGEYRRLIGHVGLQDGDAFMYCDSAVLDITANYLTAYGNPIHIIDGKEVQIWGDFLEYFGDQKQARLTGNTVMRDKEMVLTAPEFNYNTQSDVGTFYNGGRMVKEGTILTSQIGFYFHKTGESVFYDNVILKDKEGTTIYADSMRYNTKTEIVHFITKTKIVDKEGNIIYAYQGFYDTKTEKANFGSNTSINKKENKIIADIIDYDNKTKNAFLQKNVSWQDTSDNRTILSNSILYIDKNEYVRATQDPLFIAVSENKDDSITKLDTLFLSADTLISYKTTFDGSIIDNTDSFKLMYGYRNVKLYRDKYSAICDSIYYSEQDSIYKLYYHPILWMDSVQITGDSIYIYADDEAINKIKVFNNAFMIQWIEGEVFNQIKGRNIEINLEDNQLKQLWVDANAESIYFIKDDEEDSYIGENQSLSGNIYMLFQKNKVKQIKLTLSPEATFEPMKKVVASNAHLEGFNWQWIQKPKTKWDVIRDANQYQQFTQQNKFYFEKPPKN